MLPTFTEKMISLRIEAQEVGEAIEVAPESPWYPCRDAEFWGILDCIQSAGMDKDTSCAQYLTQFVLVDDLGPLGRGMFLAKAALATLAEMPEVAVTIVGNISDEEVRNGSYYYKVGVCKLVEVAGFKDTHHLEFLQHDTDERLRRRVARLYGTLQIMRYENYAP